MLFAIHYEALKEAMLSPEQQNGIFFRSKIAITKEILEEYEREIGKDPQLANYYYPLFNQLCNGKLKILKKPQAPCANGIISDYIYAANYGGKNLAISEKTLIDENDRKAMSSRGIREITTKTLFDDDGSIGHKPFERHQLTHNNCCPPSLLKPFTSGESYIVFYDKHINKSSISLINYLICEAAEEAKITIITSKHSAIQKQEIKRMIKLRPKQRLRVEHADSTTTQRIHDRFIYIDNHYEIHIPRGLDVFGLEPSWINQNAVIEIYDTYETGSEIQITLEGNGNIKPNPIKIKSIVNS